MKRPVEDLKKDLTFTAMILGREVRFVSTYGLFSPDALDEGSRLLLESIVLRGDETVLDLGCGYGALGIPIARKLSRGFVHLVDKDFVAVDYAKKSAQANDIRNVAIYLSNGFSHVSGDVRFDLVVSNLPAKVGRELYDIFFSDAHHALKPGGRIMVVTIAALKEAIKKSFMEEFGNYHKVRQDAHYVVSEATVTY